MGSDAPGLQDIHTGGGGGRAAPTTVGAPAEVAMTLENYSLRQEGAGSC